jgi:hypothetical protein
MSAISELVSVLARSAQMAMGLSFGGFAQPAPFGFTMSLKRKLNRPSDHTYHQCLSMGLAGKSRNESETSAHRPPVTGVGAAATGEGAAAAVGVRVALGATVGVADGEGVGTGVLVGVPVAVLEGVALGKERAVAVGLAGT